MKLLNLDAEPDQLTTRDMFVPTCATCHMSGLNGVGVTHDPSERLSYFLANPITEKRPNYAAAQAKMKQICEQCHTSTVVDRVYEQGEKVVENTNRRVTEAKAIVDGLRKDGTLTGPPFSNEIDFVYFDLWHYDGRTSKHGAFMGGDAAKNGGAAFHGGPAETATWQKVIADGWSHGSCWRFSSS